MKMSDWIILFCGIFVCFFLIVSYKVDVTSAVEEQTSQYSNILITACHDAAKDIAATDMENPVLSSILNRKKVINTYFKSLEMSFNATGDSNTTNLIKLYSPVVCLIDVNGYYIWYNDVYTNASGNTVLTQVETPLQTWSMQYGNYICQFTLTDNILLTDSLSGTVLKGNYKDLYIKTGIYFLADETAFNTTRNAIIINKVQDSVEYYINTHNHLGEKYNLQYSFTMPQISGEDWGRLLDGPTVIGFLQGVQAQSGDGYLNIYSIAGGEITKGYNYYIVKDANGIPYYHREDCMYATGTKIYPNAEACAREGAYPCEICKP